MLFQSARSATIRTLVFCETLCLNSADYLEVAKHFPEHRRKIRKTAVKVMWRRLLQSKQLKDALAKAAKQSRNPKLKRGDTAEQMHESMTNIMRQMVDRLKEFETLHEKTTRARKVGAE